MACSVPSDLEGSSCLIAITSSERPDPLVLQITRNRPKSDGKETLESSWPSVEIYFRGPKQQEPEIANSQDQCWNTLMLKGIGFQIRWNFKLSLDKNMLCNCPEVQPV
jgi:hypothetical protein